MGRQVRLLSVARRVTRRAAAPFVSPARVGQGRTGDAGLQSRVGADWDRRRTDPERLRLAKCPTRGRLRADASRPAGPRALVPGDLVDLLEQPVAVEGFDEVVGRPAEGLVPSPMRSRPVIMMTLASSSPGPRAGCGRRQASHLGDHDVEQDQVGPHLPRHLDARLAVGREAHLVALEPRSAVMSASA